MTAPQPGLTQPSPAPTSPDSPTPSGTTSLAASPPLTFGADAPAWAQGKTPAELAPVLSQLASLAQQGVMAPAPAAPPAYQPQYQYQYTPPVNQPPALAPDEYVTGQTLQQQAAQWQQGILQQTQQAVNPAIEMMAKTNLNLLKQQHAEVFKKYEPEVLAVLSNIPKSQWDIDTLGRAVKIVMSDHVDEIARDKARQMLDSQDPALRSTGANGYSTPPTTPAPSPVAALTEAQRNALARNGVSLKTVEEFCAKQNPPMAVDKWFKLYGATAVGDAA